MIRGDLGMAVGIVNAVIWDVVGIPGIWESGDGPWEFLKGKSLGKIFVGRAFLPSQYLYLNTQLHYGMLSTLLRILAIEHSSHNTILHCIAS